MKATLNFRRDIQKPEDHRRSAIEIRIEGDPEGVTDLIAIVRGELKGKWLEE